VSYQLKVNNYLLIILVIVLLMFTLLSVFEFIQIRSLSREVEQLKSSTSCLTCKSEGTIFIQGVGSFAYELMNGKVTTFRNVTFTDVTTNGTMTGCQGFLIKITFKDGVSEVLPATICPTDYRTEVRFTDHTGPRAGVVYSFENPISGGCLIVPGLYILVEE
jgi:hypothetical protein